MKFFNSSNILESFFSLFLDQESFSLQEINSVLNPHSEHASKNVITVYSPSKAITALYCLLTLINGAVWAYTVYCNSSVIIQAIATIIYLCSYWFFLEESGKKKTVNLKDLKTCCTVESIHTIFRLVLCILNIVLITLSEVHAKFFYSLTSMAFLIPAFGYVTMLKYYYSLSKTYNGTERK